MSLSNYTTQSSTQRLLADYRARVYESWLSQDKSAMDLDQSPPDALSQDLSPTLLVVEDNANQWLMTQLALRRRYGKVKPVWVAQEEAAVGYLNACQSRPTPLPSLILIDLYLPTAQQGLQLLQHLKSHSRYQAIPTIMLSWSNHPSDIQSALACSADGYLVKPSHYLDWPKALQQLDSYWNRQTLA